MVNHNIPFVYDSLQGKLQERLGSALRYISTISMEEALRCDEGCLAEIVRNFAATLPVLSPNQVVMDDRVIELVDRLSDRKIGHTGHMALLPIESGMEWLEDIRNQNTPFDDSPLAFLDSERSRLRITVTLSPNDPEGELRRRVDARVSLAEEYAHSVALKLIAFNKDLVEKMATELNKRKASIIKAQREQAGIGYPRVHNPWHKEQEIAVDRLLQSLRSHFTERSSRSGQPDNRVVRSFIVHGHDHQSLYELKNYVQNVLGLEEPVILREMPGLGKTLIEKFEREAEAVEIVFVLLTPDDASLRIDGSDHGRRARQNVILELGFFLGKLGRESGRVLLLHKGPIEIPSDIYGIGYIDITHGIESAGEAIRRELQALKIFA